MNNSNVKGVAHVFFSKKLSRKRCQKMLGMRNSWGRVYWEFLYTNVMGWADMHGSSSCSKPIGILAESVTRKGGRKGRWKEKIQTRTYFNILIKD